MYICANTSCVAETDQVNHIRLRRIVMTSTSLNDLVILTSSTKLIFLQYLRDNLNNRRVSQIDKEILIN